MKPFAGVRPSFNCRYARSYRIAKPRFRWRHGLSNSSHSPLASSHDNRERQKTIQAEEDRPSIQQDEGAMSRRLSELSEQSVEEGGRSAETVVEQAGFDEGLKQRLLDKIEERKYKDQFRAALTEAELSPSLGKGTRANAIAQPWEGEESTEDAALRMLNDAHKPLRRPVRIPAPRIAPKAGPPRSVNVGRPKKAPSTGARLASAKERSSLYSSIKEDEGTDKEREERLRVFKERFTPGGRPMPGTIRGLAALANERIEDAIARGQFKNLPRGKKIERDHNASSPFLDTTEYFMNKIIKKQDIVPPWIEKQQELVQTATQFRSRLRVEWKRHAARVIASKGGSLEEQIRRAEQIAAAEAIINPPLKKQEKINTVDKKGQLSQITLAGDLEVDNSSDLDETKAVISVTEEIAEHLEASLDLKQVGPEEPVEAAEAMAAQATNPNIRGGAIFVFRDPQWEQAERAYLNLAIENLNSMTRSYNLMAPYLAKKPYFSLDRELRACYADVAPVLADEIRERATAPKVKVGIFQDREGGVLENLGGGRARVYDERRPKYGFREFWRDLFARQSAS